MKLAHNVHCMTPGDLYVSEYDEVVWKDWDGVLHYVSPEGRTWVLNPKKGLSWPVARLWKRDR